MKKKDTYVGINNDLFQGMTAIGKVIRDAQVFGIITDTETCKGWNLARIDTLLNTVNNEWDKYGCLASNLPSDLAQRHHGIHKEAIRLAKELGWSGEYETDDEG